MEDLQALAAALPGRWLLVTLTVNRALFLSPAMAYSRCNERVRRVAAKLSNRGVWFAGFEVQGKTGEGWPHWHMAVWCPEGASVEHLRRVVQSAWRMVDFEVDQETGEVLRRWRTSIGLVDVQEARERKGVCTYVAKYMTKRWDAVPPWMGESTRRYRKLRISDGAYDVLERLYRHERHRGSRRVLDPGRRRLRARRPLYVRMAASGVGAVVYREVAEGVYKFQCTVPIVFAHGKGLLDTVNRYGLGIAALGHWHSIRLVADGRALRALNRDRPRLERIADEVMAHELAALRSSWSKHQRTRRRRHRHKPVSVPTGPTG